LLSAGCLAYNLRLGAQALGFGAQWLTGWAAYDADAAALFGLAANERIVAFVHIGTTKEAAPERLRPALRDIVGELHL
jgi:nitroreductase